MFEEEEGLDQRKVSFFKNKMDILAMLGLCCCVRDFSGCGQGLLSYCGTWSVGERTR